MKGDDEIISCSFFSSKSYKDYLSIIEEYKINNIIKLFRKYFQLFKSQANDNLFGEKEESFIKYIENKLINKIKSEYQFEEIELKNISKEEIVSNDIYKEINSFLTKFYEENNLNKKEEDNYNDKLQNICKYLILCNAQNTKINLYKLSYASDTLEILLKKIIKSHFLKIVELNNHLERFFRFLNIFFEMEEGFVILGKNDLYELLQISLKNINKFFEDFKGIEIIENYQNKIITFIEKQKNSFQELMERNNHDINMIIEFLKNNINKDMIELKKSLLEELNKLEKNVEKQLNRIEAKTISINKEISISLSTKEKVFVTISFCTLGIGSIIYGLFYALPNMIINAFSEERKFHQFLEEIEENIIDEFLCIRDSIKNNIESYKNIITKKIKRFYEIINIGNIKKDEYWKKAKENYLVIYNKYKSLKNYTNLIH